MYTDLESFLSMFDFEEYDYFYHQTNRGTGEEILESGLLVEGSNILEVDNLIYTTTIELKPSDIEDIPTFLDFLKDHEFYTQFRDTLEMVFIVAPKAYDKEIVEGYDHFVNGTFFRGIIQPEHILGYINVLTQEVTLNEYCDYKKDPFIY